MKKTLEFLGGVLAWLYDHEPINTGFVAQLTVGGVTGWLLDLAGSLHLPEGLHKALLGLITLAGSAAIIWLDQWKRSRVASASTAAKLAASRVSAPPPIPLAVVAHEAKVEEAKP